MENGNPPSGRGSLPPTPLRPREASSPDLRVPTPPAPLADQRFDWVWFLFTIQGRITRRHYWLYYFVPLFVISLGLVMVDVSFGNYDPETGWGLLSGLFSLAALWPGIAVAVKRAPDRDRSGWFLLVMLIPIAGAIWLLVELGFLPGTPGANRFGPPPPA